MAPERTVRQRVDPERLEWGVLPALTFSSDIGLGFGAIMSLARFAPGYKPYLWRLEVLWLMTVKEKPGGGGFELPYHDDYIKLDLPGLLGGRLRLNAELAFSRYTTSGYFGFGNASKVDDAARALNSHYHLYDRIYPTASLQARVKVTDHIHALIGGQVTYNWINIYEGSLLERDLAARANDPELRRLLRGADDFANVELNLGWIWDSRDHEYMPTRGAFHEISWRFSPGVALGTDHGYGGVNMTLRYYRAVAGPKLILAGRAMVDLLVGQPPFFELARHGGLFRSDALGGARAIRGIGLQRYHGKIKLMGNLEARSRFLRFSLWSARFQLGAVAFFDFGRCFADWTDSAALDGSGLGLKLGTGGGLRLAWGEAFVIRADVAWSPDAEPIGYYIDVNHIF